jgi:hypothetical protein
MTLAVPRKNEVPGINDKLRLSAVERSHLEKELFA